LELAARTDFDRATVIFCSLIGLGELRLAHAEIRLMAG
jgi:hypothetical protein